MPDPQLGEPLWWLDYLGKKLTGRQARLKRYDAYYQGDHDLKFATKKFREAFGGLFSEYAENVCELVVESVKERLAVVGFRIGENPQADRDAWRIWQTNQMDSWSSVAHEIALVQEQAYLCVWADPRDRLTPRMTIEQPQQMIVAYEPGDVRVRAAALKRWRDDWTGRIFATVYLPNATYKYQSRQKASDFSVPDALETYVVWEERRVDGEPWPLPNALGIIPIVPLTNKPRLDGSGVSEIKSVIPINDAINKLTSDMLLAAEFSAFRQRWVTNFSLETDPDTGKPVEPWKIAVDRLLIAPPAEDGGAAAQFGEFSETDLSNFTKAIEQRLQMIATITRTPRHYLLTSGSIQTGAGFEGSEAGLVAKAKERAIFYGEGWEEGARLAFAVLGDPRAKIIDSETMWRDVESRTEAEHVDSLVKMRTLGVPDEVLWEKWGASPKEIARWKVMRAQQALEVAAAFDPFAQVTPPGGTPA